MGHRHDARATQRGYTLLEVLVAGPILLFCVLFMSDFARGLVAGQRLQRGARQVAFAEGRRADFGGSAAGVPGTDTLHDAHLGGDGPAPAHGAARRLVDVGYRHLGPPPFLMMEPMTRALSMGTVGFDQQADEFIAGDDIPVSVGTLGQDQQKGRLRFLSGPVERSVRVALWADVKPEPNGPSNDRDGRDPYGWWDPWEVIRRFLLLP